MRTRQQAGKGVVGGVRAYPDRAPAPTYNHHETITCNETKTDPRHERTTWKASREYEGNPDYSENFEYTNRQAVLDMSIDGAL